MEDIELKRKQLLELMDRPIESEEPVNYTSHKVNWILPAKNWEECKKINDNLLSQSERLVFLAHDKDCCHGKPQLIQNTIQKITMIRKVEKKDEEEETYYSYKFIDDKFDRRYDGREILSLALDFWTYRVIDKGKEYYLFSEEKLSEEYSTIIGMNIDIADLSGLSDTLRLSKLANIFIVKESNPAVKVIPQDKIIEFSKSCVEKNGWDMKGFEEYVFTHPDGNVYDYTPEFNLLRISQFLSGKFEGYPLHLMKLGAVGTGKTTEAEAIDYKFKEELGILEAGTSRMKVLVPSFKEKPANLGYICNCNRIAIIDELMKMVSSAIQQQHLDVNNYFGELNMLLEQKKRLVGSGNDNSTIVKSSAKVCITTNPIKGKSKLSQHLTQLDNSTLSRMLVWVQAKDETERIYSKNGIKLSKYINNINPENTMPTPSPLQNALGGCVYVHGNDRLCELYYDFLTIYDSCQVFLVQSDTEKLKQIFKDSVNRTKEPMKQVWRSRGLHHVTLILDGIVKYRCLFKDFDSTFTPIDSDYQLLTNILTKMIDGWETDLEYQPFNDGF